MRMLPESEDDTLAKVALFTKFTELLPTALEDRQGGALGSMVFHLLDCMQEVVKVHTTMHQNLFR